MTSTFKRRVSILLCVAMVLAMLPMAVYAETGNNLYLKPNSNWLDANARFAAYFMYANGSTMWVDAASVDAANNIYGVTIPEGFDGTTMIWCRMNPGTTENNWNNKWNQSGDLVIPTDGTNLFTVNEEQWDCGQNGVWSVYTPATDGGETEVTEPTESTEPVEPVSITVYCINSNNWTEVAAYAWIEGGAGTTWPGVLMTKTGETVNGFDVYEATFDVAYENVIFNNNNGGSQTDDLTFNDGQYYDLKSGAWYASLADVPAVDPLATDYYLAGAFNGWSTTANEFKLDAEGSSTGYISLELAENTTYEFKVVQAGSWTGCATTIIGDVSGLAFSSSVNDNCKITTAAAGTYVFAFNISGSTLSVTYPASVCTHEEQNTVAGYAPTCTTPGLTDGATCASCGATLSAQEAIPATGHTDENGDEVCDTCGTALYMTIYFQNNWLWTNINLYYWGSTTAPGADWPGTAMELRGNDGQYDIYVLKVPVDITGMQINGTKNESTDTDQTPDITSDWYDGICYSMTWVDGNQVVSDDITNIVPCFHEEETFPGFAPTCFESGLTDGVICSVCGETLVEPTEIPATGVHTEGESVTYILLEPDCYREGEKQVIVWCSVCGDEISNEILPIPATGVHVDDDGDGYCDNGGECIIEHTYNDGYYNGGDENGHYNECDRCAYYDPDSQSAHTYVNGLYIYDAESHYNKCDVCGYYDPASQAAHTDTDGDCICDTCVKKLHIDDDGDCVCDVCGSEFHIDESGDCLCDVCESEFHTDEDDDGFCEYCGACIVHGDADGDGYCDNCWLCIIEHSYNDGYYCSGDENGHYNECDRCAYYDPDSQSAHTYVNGLYIYDAESHYNKCDVCDYIAPDSPAAHADDDADGRCDVCGYVMVPAVLSLNSISLEGNIAINYYMTLSDAVLADETAYMQFTMADGEVIQIPVSQGVETLYNGKIYYVFTCAVSAKEMTDDVKSQFFYDGGSTEEKAYNVKAYADYILANSTNEELKALVTAMLHYGAASQTHFGYNTDNLANAGLEAPDYTDVTIAGNSTAAGQGTDLVSLYAASLILKSETTLRFFFQAEEGATLAVTYNGESLEVKERSGLYYVDVVGISAKDLAEDVTVTISDGTNTADVSYNPMAYCAAVRNDTTGAFDQEMQDLVAALYLYNEAAKIYF